MSLRPDELRSLDAETERCDECFHLEALHSNGECDSSCRVANCGCDGTMPIFGPRTAAFYGWRGSPTEGDLLCEAARVQRRLINEATRQGRWAGFDSFNEQAMEIARENLKPTEGWGTP